MIYSLKGTLTYLEPTFAVVECGGVGFKCFVSTTTITSLTTIGTEVRLLTYMSIREDAMDLYGFSTQNELEAFKLLISVNGVGPKAAISILSALPPDRLAVAVSAGMLFRFGRNQCPFRPMWISVSAETPSLSLFFGRRSCDCRDN